MGGDTQVMCPYCSTLYVYDAGLSELESIPAGCVVTEAAA
jgi:hypothetical protein